MFVTINYYLSVTKENKMSKTTTKFNFIYTKNLKVVRDCKLVPITFNLNIECVGYINSEYPFTDVFNRYSVDIEAITGASIKEVLEHSIDLADIEDQAVRHLARLDEPSDFFKMVAAIAYPSHLINNSYGN